MALVVIEKPNREVYRGPSNSWNFLSETLSMDVESSSVEDSLRLQISKAIDSIQLILHSGDSIYYEGPEKSWEVFFETLELDKSSSRFDAGLRQDIDSAYHQIKAVTAKSKTIQIPIEEATAMQEILNIKEGTYEGAGRDEVIKVYSADFGEGMEVDIKVCNGNTPYVDAVIFEHGCEIYPLDVTDSLLGQYIFEVNATIYIVNVIPDPCIVRVTNPTLRFWNWFKLDCNIVVEGSEIFDDKKVLRQVDVNITSIVADVFSPDRIIEEWKENDHWNTGEQTFEVLHQ